MLLICIGVAGQVEMRFYCNCQTLDQLRALQHLSPAEFDRQHPGVFRSAIVHHGGLRAAFAACGVEYSHEEISGWQTKVIPFLGRIPDISIAGAVEVTASVLFSMDNLAAGRVIPTLHAWHRFCLRCPRDELVLGTPFQNSTEYLAMQMIASFARGRAIYPSNGNRLQDHFHHHDDKVSLLVRDRSGDLLYVVSEQKDSSGFELVITVIPEAASYLCRNSVFW